MIGMIARTLRSNVRIFILPFVAIASATSALIMLLALGRYMGASITTLSSARFQSAHAKVTIAPGPEAESTLQSIRRLPTVGKIYSQMSYDAAVTRTTGSTELAVYTSADESFNFHHHIAGEHPRQTNEIALSREASERLGLVPGNTLTLTVWYQTPQRSEKQAFSRPMRVSGIYDIQSHPLGTNNEAGFITPEADLQWRNYIGIGQVTPATSFFISAATGHSDEELLESLERFPEITIFSRSAMAIISPPAFDRISSVIYISIGAAILVILGLTFHLVCYCWQNGRIERANELRQMQFLGATPHQVRTFLRFDVLATGIAASLTGMLIGRASATIIPVLMRSGGAGVALPPTISLPVVVLAAAFIIGLSLATTSCVWALRNVPRIKETPRRKFRPVRPVMKSIWWATAAASMVITVALSSRLTLLTHLENTYPYDVEVASTTLRPADASPISATELRAIEQLSGIDYVAPNARVSLKSGAHGLESFEATAVDPADIEIPGLTDSSIVLPWKMQTEVDVGQAVLRGDSHIPLNLEVVYGAVYRPVITMDNAKALIGHAPTLSGMWITMFSETGSEIVDRVTKALASHDSELMVSSDLLRGQEAYEAVSIIFTNILFTQFIFMMVVSACALSSSLRRVIRDNESALLLRLALGQSRSTVYGTITRRTFRSSSLVAASGWATGMGVGILLTIAMFAALGSSAQVKFPAVYLLVTGVLQLLQLKFITGRAKNYYSSSENLSMPLAPI